MVSTLAEIPDEERAQIADHLRRAGVRVNEANIRQAYRLAREER